METPDDSKCIKLTKQEVSYTYVFSKLYWNLKKPFSQSIKSYILKNQYISTKKLLVMFKMFGTLQLIKVFSPYTVCSYKKIYSLNIEETYSEWKDVEFSVFTENTHETFKLRN